MSNLKTADLFGLDDREKSKESQNIYDVAIAGGERKRNVFAPTRKDAIHQAWQKLDPELGGADTDWDEIEIKRRRK